MIAAIVPAHNEEAYIGACVGSLIAASRCPRLGNETVSIIVALDACTDATEKIVLDMGAQVVVSTARNVGVARALGAHRAVEQGARWLAFTDADTVVDRRWLSSQLALCSDAVCGTVAVRDWGSYGERMRRQHDATYADVDGHRHIHGANLGVSTAAYCRAGGFPALASSEDVALVDALERCEASIAWSAVPRVFTSARTVFRAPGGFGETLQRIQRERAWVPDQEAA